MSTIENSIPEIVRKDINMRWQYGVTVRVKHIDKNENITERDDMICALVATQKSNL